MTSYVVCGRIFYEISTKASSSTLQVLIKILDSSKKSRSKAIEAGAMCTLIELLADSNRSKCEKILHIIKLLCESPEGRVAFIEHRLGVGAIAKKLFEASTICFKILLLICSFPRFTHTIEYRNAKKLIESVSHKRKKLSVGGINGFRIGIIPNSAIATFDSHY
ncbi:hypothetical protein L2E82_01207 [Cichorium intybus]|uniref:Uncharacterized protein n=1 Tax=Cichorium intybus TaxID=13427 RepID=A0ACB9GXW9_CICIN|nr:hypothetical protein L2E82_01207 [Cichorium intybus]